MEPLAIPILTIGSLAIAAAPAWLLTLGELPATASPRRLRLMTLACVFVACTAALGSAWILVLGSMLHVDQSPAWIWSGVLVGASVPNVLLELRKRLRSTRRRLWREAHADEAVAPESNAERRVSEQIDAVLKWHVEVTAAFAMELKDRGWITQKAIIRADAARPRVDLSRRVARRFLGEQPAATRSTVALWQAGVGVLAEEMNGRHLLDRKTQLAPFFETVESSPLTEEQVEAVVCFDDRIRLIAAAGSGKTSTLVAKAVYAVEAGLVAPERILVLAFNRDAASSARERLLSRFRERGLDSGNEVVVQTFHGLGRSLTGKARGRMPSTPRWIDSDAQRREHVGEIVRRLRDQDASFDSDWRLFHALYAGREHFDGAESTAQAEARLYTRQGVEVRSRGEQLIADWLWFRGVEFEYERPYDIDVATPERRQYAPDFYYPSAAVWHEHFALDRSGVPPAEFTGYLEDVRWKRSLHREHGTTLVETTMGALDAGTALDQLEQDLRAAGVAFDTAGERDAQALDAKEVGRTEDLLQKLVACMRADGVDEGVLAPLIERLPSGIARMRAGLLLKLLGAVNKEWQRDLDEIDAIDFDGMVNEASEGLESGRVLPEFDLVLVDEFQDLAPSFARLLRNLLRREESRLFAVGDDWQAINAFAGADLDEMLRFHQHFGPGTTLRLERTFRSSQAICDVAGAFIARNPAQLQKAVSSVGSPAPDGIRIRAVRDRAAQTRILRRYLEHVQARVDRRRADGAVEKNRTVLVLGRYRWGSDLMPSDLRLSSVDVEFRTVHSAKGLEADHVVVLDVVGGRDGFPSAKANDPVLDLLRPTVESFPAAEERRLLYVAMTRARRSVLILTVEDSLSPFVHELTENGSPLQNEADDSLEVCPDCHIGIVIRREGRFGPFVTCVRRGCGYKRQGGPVVSVLSAAR